MEHLYDVIVIGGGPAGYTAALYAARAGLDTLVLEKLSAGGQMTQTAQIDNYPGFDRGIDGFALGRQMRAQAERFGARSRLAQVHAAELRGDIKQLETGDGTFLGKTVIIATGASHRPLGLEGEAAFLGKGLAYCAACDGMFFRGKRVAVIGGGNTAVGDALALSRICQQVTLVHRRDSLRADRIYHSLLESAPNIHFCWNSTVHRLLGQDRLSGLELRDTVTGALSTLDVDGVFVSIGQNPETAFLRGQLSLDRGGYLLADESTRTDVPGVFAAGDVRAKTVRQIITAAADGAAAASAATQYLSQIA